MPKAAVIHEKGLPEVFRWEDVEVGFPMPGEIRIRNTAVGVNYVDTYHRRGIPHPWPTPPLPFVLGFEGVGHVMAVGDGVSEFKVGDHVCYSLPPHGAYSQERNYPAPWTIKVPEDLGLEDHELAAVLLKGLTTQYLVRRTYPICLGDYVLIHAAAGGMGHALCPWAKDLGAVVIGTVGSNEKAVTARDLGCDHVINYSTEDFEQRCREITGGVGVHVVYESIGKDTLRKSLRSLRLRGYCVSYGHASGSPAPVDIVHELGEQGSLFITRPTLMHHMTTREELLSAAEDLFDVIRRKIVRPKISTILPLSKAAEAHELMEDRKTTGSIVLLPYA